MKFRAIRTGINCARENVKTVHQNLEDLKIVVFSDHHRGSRDGADDFRNCEQNYLQALNYYFERGYTLILLGDVEECWQNEPNDVIEHYKNVLLEERKFHLQNRLIRIWGNHDDVWQYKDRTKELLNPIFPNIEPLEAIEFVIHKNDNIIGQILMLHGHQGTFLSSRFAGVSKFLVRYLWRPAQRIFKISPPTPSKNKALENQTDRALDYWASIRGRQLIVAGHTHSYLFGSFALEDTNDKPCYFNTGCCSYKNGSITGLELSNKEIKLVHWDIGSIKPKTIQKDLLEGIFERCDDRYW